MAVQSRRGFLDGLLPVVGGALVASTLAGCVANGEQDAMGESPLRRLASRPVQLRPGMRYLNVMPRTVPAVRLLANPHPRG
jgi:hypothetical protein